MKIGDRVRITRGEHAGRLGVIVDTAEQLNALDRLLKASKLRDSMRQRLTVPEGCQAVKMDITAPDLAADRTAVFSETLLIPVEDKP